MKVQWRRKYWLLLWLALFVIASLIGAIDALGAYVAISPDEVHAPQRQKVLIWNLVKWNLWVVLVPPVVLLSRLFPFNRHSPVRNIILHLVSGVCVALAHFALLVVIYSLMTYAGEDKVRFLREQFSDFTTNQFYIFVSDFLVNILLYSLTLISVHALEFYWEARSGQIRSAQLEAQLAQAQLQALKMQLHPHFLFNALHSISAHLKDTETARSMLAKLGDFLRLTLANIGVQEVTLKQEIEFLRCYLDIEQTRFRDRLAVDIKIEPETWDALLPNLILQPLVENAIRHGIAPLIGEGRISIRASRLNGNLKVRVEDNGSGMVLKNQGTNSILKEGVGLRTTRERLARLYPGLHRLSLQDARNGGLLVVLEMPFKVTKGKSH